MFIERGFGEVFAHGCGAGRYMSQEYFTTWQSLDERLRHTKEATRILVDASRRGRKFVVSRGRCGEVDFRRTVPIHGWWLHQDARSRRYLMDSTSRSYEGGNEQLSKRTRWKVTLKDGEAFIRHSRDGMDVVWRH